MADSSAFSMESPPLVARKKWGLTDYALGLLGFLILSAVAILVLNYGRSEGVVNLVVSLKQPDFFRASSDKILIVSRTLVKGAVERGAVCLDGSPPSYHLHKGHGSGINNWLVHLEGGGWCSNNRSCFDRSQTRLGSSYFMEDSIVFGGSLSNSPSKNPDFYNWNRVKVRYCDGGSYSGDVEVPIEAKSNRLNEVKKIFYRGQRVWQVVMDELLSKGMLNAKKAFLSGCSAGGLASILHCNDFRSLLPKNANVKCLSDAGLFLDVEDVQGNPTIQSFYKDVVSLHGITAKLPQTCKPERDVEQCFFPQYLLKTIEAPLFILNPAYDIWQIEHVLVPNSADPSQNWRFCKSNPASCSKSQLKTLQGFRTKLLEAIDVVEGSDEGGLFINSCFIHCQSENDDTWHGVEAPIVNKRIRGEFHITEEEKRDIFNIPAQKLGSYIKTILNHKEKVLLLAQSMLDIINQ